MAKRTPPPPVSGDPILENLETYWALFCQFAAERTQNPTRPASEQVIPDLLQDHPDTLKMVFASGFTAAVHLCQEILEVAATVHDAEHREHAMMARPKSQRPRA